MGVMLQPYSQLRWFRFIMEKIEVTKGSEKDIKMLDETFSNMSFEVTIEKDLDEQKTFEKTQEFIKNLDDATDMIVISINSHSNTRDSFRTSDNKSLDVYNYIYKYKMLRVCK